MKKLLLAAALAVIALTATVGSASAASFRTEASNITSISEGKVTFSAAGFINIACRITLTGRIRAGLFNKVAGTQFGEITAVAVNECERGTVTQILIEAERVFPITYQSIEGALPEAVTLIAFNITRTGFRLRETGGTECLYAGDVFASTRVTGRNPYTTTGNIAIIGDNIGGGTGFCAFLNGTMTGEFRPLEPAIRITRL